MPFFNGLLGMGHGRCVLNIFSLMMVLLVAGCGSLVYRTDANPFSSVTPGIYPGVRTDIDLIHEAADPTPVVPWGLPSTPDPYAVTLCTIIFTLDMPLSAICDTVFLPYDLLVRPAKSRKDSDDESPGSRGSSAKAPAPGGTVGKNPEDSGQE